MTIVTVQLIFPIVEIEDVELLTSNYEERLPDRLTLLRILCKMIFQIPKSNLLVFPKLNQCTFLPSIRIFW